jgi:plastocyanin
LRVRGFVSILELESWCFMRRIMRRTSLVVALLVTLATLVTLVASPSWASSRHHHHGDNHTINIPGTDKFVPFHLTITEGDTVTWVNSDTDDHTVVSDDAFNDAGHNGLNQLIPGTVNNNGQAGSLTLEFDHAGTFVYYCRFHSMLDADNQPIAPGPEGGIQDANGNFGTPMSGVITVVDKHHNDDD